MQAQKQSAQWLQLRATLLAPQAAIVAPRLLQLQPRAQLACVLLSTLSLEQMSVLSVAQAQALRASLGRGTAMACVA